MQKMIINLENLKEDEILKIKKVLERDDELKRSHELKLLKLKESIQKLEEEKLDIPKDLISESKVCVRCKTSFEKLINTSEFCPTCGYKVCQKCRDYLDKDKIISNDLSYNWICKFCSAKKQLLLRNGEWIYCFNKNDSRIENEKIVTATDIIKSSLAEVEKKKQIEELKNSPQLSNIYEKARNSNFLSKSLSAFSAIETSKKMKNKLEEFIQSTRNNSTQSTSSTINQPTLTTQKFTPIQELTKNIKNEKPSTSQENNKNNLKTITNDDIFGSLTSSEIDLNDETFLTQLDKISDNSEEKLYDSNSKIQSQTPSKITFQNIFSDNMTQKTKLQGVSSAPVKSMKPIIEVDVDPLPVPLNLNESKKFTKIDKNDNKIVQDSNNNNNNIEPTSINQIVTDINLDGDKNNLNVQDTNSNSDLKDKKSFNKSVSISSVRSDMSKTENHKIKGKISFIMSYNKKTSNLKIQIKKCESLASMNNKNKPPDPYVKLYLLKNNIKQDKRKTSVKREKFHPIYDESFVYTIPSDMINSTIILASVWHNDKFGTNKFLGETRIHLNLSELEKSNSALQTYNLTNKVD